MPNWCCATVEISATEKEIKRLKKAIEEGSKDGAQKGLLNAMAPQPEFKDDQEWYSWNVENWGTKWEVSHVNVVDTSKTEISLGFDTAWGPALQAFQTWAEEDPDNRSFSYKYYEPGMAFLGTATFSDGFYEDDFVSADDDKERYREIATDEWGEDFSWEDEEEDEEDELTLTEDEESPDPESELRAALEELNREFGELMSAESDPEYQYLKEDIDTLSRRVADYAARQEAKTLAGDVDE